jgi:hypothetical protein
MHMKMTPKLRLAAVRRAKDSRATAKFLCFALASSKKLARLMDREIILRSWWQPCHRCGGKDYVSIYVQPNGKLRRDTMHGGEL